ncbi:MAG: hypothetical protein D3910_08780, partial [Candidatus Electrothrix sp. ATG2]|nr:hypothetical protein [Candidatus Electrothrix sp. ATG2]
IYSYGGRQPVARSMSIGTSFPLQYRSGTVIIDMAVESGGNVEGSELDTVVEMEGVKILGIANLPGRVAATASQMYSANLGNFIEHFWDKAGKTLTVDQEDEIMQGALITHDGEVVSKMYKNIMKK